jgi:hypothetical protein
MLRMGGAGIRESVIIWIRPQPATISMQYLIFGEADTGVTLKFAKTNNAIAKAVYQARTGDTRKPAVTRLRRCSVPLRHQQRYHET